MDANVLQNVEVQAQQEFVQNVIEQPVQPTSSGQIVTTQQYHNLDRHAEAIENRDNVTHVSVSALSATGVPDPSSLTQAVNETIILNITSDVDLPVSVSTAKSDTNNFTSTGVANDVFDAAQNQAQFQSGYYQVNKGDIDTPGIIQAGDNPGQLDITTETESHENATTSDNAADTTATSIETTPTRPKRGKKKQEVSNTNRPKRTYKKRDRSDEGLEIESTPEGESGSTSKRQKIYTQRFRDEWLVDPKFADWLMRVPNNPKKARCSKCQCTVQAKKSSLDSHTESEKHKGLNDEDLFEGPDGPETIVIQSVHGDTIIHTETVEETVEATENVDAGNADEGMKQVSWKVSQDQSGLSKTKISYIEKRRIMRAELEKQTQRAEMKISAWSAEHHIPFRSLESLIGVLADSFSDSKIAKKLKMKRTKAACVVYNVIGKDFIESVERSLQQVTELGKTRYSLILNEIPTTGTTNADTQLAIVVKYFDGSTLLTRLLGLITISEPNAECLFEELLKCITSKGLSLNECIGWTVLSADPCDLMHGQINSLRSRMMQANPSIISFRCTCHNSALVASHACEVLPSGCEKLVHDLYNFFARMTKRSTQYGDFQEFVDTQPHRLLKPFQTQWLSLLQCVSSIVDKWSPLLGFMQDQLTVGKNQRAKEILDAMSNPYNKLFFEFLCFVLPKINALSVTSEAECPTIDKVHDHISLPYKDLLALYMHPEYVTQSPVSQLSPTSEFHMHSLENTYLGTNVMRGLASLGEPPESKGQFVAVCRNFIMTACQQIQQRFPLDDPILIAASKISVKSAKSGKVVSFISEVMCHFPQILELTNEQEVDNQWRSLVFEEELSTDLEFDVFWGKVMNMPRYASLWFCVKAIMMLPVPNRDSERLFEQIDKARTAEKNRISLDSILKVISAQESIHAAGASETFEPTEGMYARFRNDIYKA